MPLSKFVDDGLRKFYLRWKVIGMKLVSGFLPAPHAERMRGAGNNPQKAVTSATSISTGAPYSGDAANVSLTPRAQHAQCSRVEAGWM